MIIFPKLFIFAGIAVAVAIGAFATDVVCLVLLNDTTNNLFINVKSSNKPTNNHALVLS